MACCFVVAKGLGKRKYYVFNPTTKQFVIIPSIIGGRDARKTIRFMGLAFHRTHCVHYKLVCFRTLFRNGNLFEIQIYSSEAGKWRISKQSFSVPYFTSTSYGAYSNGAIHWIPNSSELICFNLEVERLQKIFLPGRLSSTFIGMEPLYFGESGTHLHLVDLARHETGLRLNVYEMLRDYSGWIMKHRVRLDHIPAAYPNRQNLSSEMIESHDEFDVIISNYMFEVFDVVIARNEEEEEEESTTFMVIRTPENIVRYDVVNRSFEKIRDRFHKCSSLHPIYIFFLRDLFRTLISGSV